MAINSFPTSDDFCRLVITFANSLDPDQAPSSGSKLFDTLKVFLKVFFFEKVNLKKKKSTDDKKACKITQHAKS